MACSAAFGLWLATRKDGVLCGDRIFATATSHSKAERSNGPSRVSNPFGRAEIGMDAFLFFAEVPQ